MHLPHRAPPQSCAAVEHDHILRLDELGRIRGARGHALGGEQALLVLLGVLGLRLVDVAPVAEVAHLPRALALGPRPHP